MKLPKKTFPFPTEGEIIYVIGFDNEGQFVPFYVGRSDRSIGRIGDYVSGNFSASTDFKVNRAVERLRQTGKVVVVRFDECTDSRGEERKSIEQFRGMGFILLNDFRLTPEGRQDEEEAQKAIWAFVDNLLRSLDSRASSHSVLPQLDQAAINGLTGTGALGYIRGQGGKPYADGLERMEIWINKKDASLLPYQLGAKVKVKLCVNGTTYEAGLRSTEKCPFVWVCPDMLDGAAQKVSLARVSRANNLEKNEKILLSCVQSVIQIHRI